MSSDPMDMLFFQVEDEGKRARHFVAICIYIYRYDYVCA